LNIIFLLLSRKQKNKPGKVKLKGIIRSKENEKSFTDLFSFNQFDRDGTGAGTPFQ
jgi:hypothetical protein